MSRKPFPFPEGVSRSDTPFTVIESQGELDTDLKKKTMIVPLAETREALAVRSRETGRVQITPVTWKEMAKAKGITQDTVEALETVRVNRHLLVRDVDDLHATKFLSPDQLHKLNLLVSFLYSGPPETGKVGAARNVHTLRLATQVALHFCWTGSGPEALAVLDGLVQRTVGSKGVEVFRKAVTKYRNLMGCDPTTCLCPLSDKDVPFAGVLEAAQAFDEEFPPLPAECGGAGKKAFVGARGPASAVVTEVYKGENAAMEAEAEHAGMFGSAWQDDYPTAKGHIPPVLGTRDHDGWARVKFVYPPLVVTLKAKHRAARHLRPTDFGTRLRYVNRYCTDMRLFARRRSKGGPGGGTVVIDASGSMGLTFDELERMVRAAPAAMVLTYAGSSTADYGELWTVAKNGKMAQKNHLRPRMAGNCIDGPVLAWLSRQKKPRIWVSDGGVTGKREEHIGSTTRNALQRLIREREIYFVGEIDSAARVLDGYAADVECSVL